jgi:NAD(P)H dehydrogenase (quinone)
MKAIIIYQSAYGHVEQMVEKTKSGLETAGCEVTLSKAIDTDPESLPNYDIIIFGSPVRMGSIGDEMKTFIDKTGGLWMKAAAKDKVAGVLVSGGGFNSGIELTQIALYSTLIELGMVLVGFSNDLPGYGLGANQWGPYARVGSEGKDGPNDDCLTACFEYGKRLALFGKKIKT